MERRFSHCMVLWAAAALCAPVLAQAPASPPVPSPAASAPAASTSPPTPPSSGTSAPTPGGPNASISNTANATDLSNVRIGRVILGSGEPGSAQSEREVATQVYEGLYHAPQYLPYYPTAATIWPRAIEVPCHKVGADLLCDRYVWRPEYGRAEYLFFIPILQSDAGAAPSAGTPGSQDRTR